VILFFRRRSLAIFHRPQYAGSRRF
jgi:hypothetical protein